jgi:hypothetical protein
MPLWAEVALAILGVVVAGGALAVWLGSRWQQRTLSKLIERLVGDSTSHAAARIDFDDIENLSAPVARYFRRAFPQGQRQIRLVRMEQAGVLRTDVGRDRWFPFRATHIVAPPATGFVWNARVEMAPLLHVRVRDALVRGHGSGQVSLLSAFTLMAANGNLEMNSGSLHRYLAEAVWYPTALIPSSKLQWRDIDENAALATLTDYGVTVSLEFRFNAIGEITGIYTPARWGTFDGEYKQVRWEGHFRKYEKQDGIVVPSEGEVGWYFEGEWRPVWKGRITDVHYELVR